MVPPELVKIDAPLGEGVADQLQLKGVKAAPQAIDMSHITPVIDLGQAGFTAWRLIESIDSARAVNGVNVQMIHPIAPQGFISGGIAAIATTVRENCRVLALNSNIDFDAAGLAAFAGKVLCFSVQMSGPTATVFSTVSFTQLTVAGAGTTSLTQRLTMPGGALPFLLPFGMILRVRAYVQDGTVWPANTVMSTAVTALATAATRRSPI